MDDNPGEKGRLPIDQFMDELDTSVLDADEKLSVTDEKLAGHRVLDTFSGSEETEDEAMDDRYSRRSGYESGSNARGGQKKDALSLLLKLAEVMEQQHQDRGYRGDDGYGYPEDSEDNHLLKKQPFDSDLLASYDDQKSLRRAASVMEEDENVEWRAAPFCSLEEGTLPGTMDTTESHSEATKKFRRGRRINILGCLVNLLFYLAFGFYLYVRITKTLDLGKYYAYGIVVLVIEVLGATTSMIYGLNLLMDPVHEKFVEDEENPGLPKVALNYAVRVLVPCYKEDPEIVRATLKAAWEAALPIGCTRMLYLCDDSKDPKKRRICEDMGLDVVYVSGRSRTAGEINGKSANLNNCLGQIYPENIPVPPNEIVCIFDADQVCNRDFFLKTLPLFDGGDDVGMVLSPQAYHNINMGADIFNHSNIPFWEYAQRGYDALGFISCTGTNFLSRSQALQEAGWSPEYTLTEDYALGMELKMRGWHCRYVEEYLAIGEAPDQIRNCFQQRSRWSKGHFQIILSSDHCPLFQFQLGIMDRIMYCSGVWAYLVGALTTPLFIIIPILTIWAGVFPIVVSWWAALALSIYGVAQTLILNFTRKRAHVYAHWFANVANNILWFTFVKAAWRSLLSTFGKTITFKTTLKGMNRLKETAIGDLWMPTVTFTIMFISLIMGIVKLVNGPTVVSTLAISIVWSIYVMIPPYLVLHYAFVGKGTSLRVACKIAFLLSYFCVLGAMLLLWFVYPKEYDFGEAVGASYNFYYTQRVGALSNASYNPISYRGDSLLYETDYKIVGAKFPDLTGGYMTSGQHGGTLKMTMPIAFTTTMLAWGVLAFPEGYRKGNQTATAMDNIRWGTDYLLKTYTPETLGKNEGFRIIYQVGNATTDANFYGTPESMTPENAPRPIFNVSTAAGASDITGQLVAAFVSTALVFEKSDPTYYTSLMNEALKLYGQAAKFQNRYTHLLAYDCPSMYAKTNIAIKRPQLACPNPVSYLNGSAAIFYNSTSYRDDLAWAAAWMYYATRDGNYLNDVNVFYAEHLDQESTEDMMLLSDWDHVFWPATVLLANLTSNPSFLQPAKDYMQKWICGTTESSLYTPRGRAFNPDGPEISQTANAAFLALVYANIKSDRILAADATRYQCWARTQIRYMIGDSGRSVVVGYGKDPPTHAQDMASSCPLTGECSKVNALYTPQPNPRVAKGALTSFATFSDVYTDLRSSNDTRVGIEYNAGFTSALAGLNQVPGSWDQCLQGFGILTTNTAVCQNSIFS